MKTIQLAVCCVLCALFALALHAQGFNSGSNGSYGPLNPPTGTTTLDLPADGIFHCTTIDIPSGALLKFRRNSLNTPVYLLATGDVNISGQIDVSAAAPVNSMSGGQGGPGGYDGGASGFISAGVTRLAGSGMGPGGGKRGDSTTAGGGSYGTTNANQAATRGHGATYGSPLLIPLVGGSGGGGFDGISNGHGGGGGGALLIASNTKIVLVGTGNKISAFGGNGVPALVHDGSGGGIRLVAPRVFGTGTIDVRGNVSYGATTVGQTSGRIRIDSFFKVDPLDSGQFLNLTYSPTTAASVGANLVVFPPNNAHLDIVQAAGTAIAEGTTQAVSVVLPIDAPTAQTITVRARNFAASVPIRVALVPESGDIAFFDSTIDNTSVNPATTTVNVTMPTNVRVDVQVWSR